jgi:hypothetical protein
MAWLDTKDDLCQGRTCAKLPEAVFVNLFFLRCGPGECYPAVYCTDSGNQSCLPATASRYSPASAPNLLHKEVTKYDLQL